MFVIYPILIHQLRHDCQYATPEPETSPNSTKHFGLENSGTYSDLPHIGPTWIPLFVGGVRFVWYGHCVVGRVFWGALGGLGNGDHVYIRE